MKDKLSIMPYLLMVLLFLSNGVIAKSVASPKQMYAPYARLLTSYVSNDGLVDYAGMQAAQSKDCKVTLLNSAIWKIQSLDKKNYNGFDNNDKIAFWINAYNLFTLKAIVDHYPINAKGTSALIYPKNSIRQIPGVWDKLTFTVLGVAQTLNDIEHEILRKQFTKPQIHMALVCGAMSCPRLRNEPYIGNQLDNQLDNQTIRFMNDDTKFVLDKKNKVIAISKIFHWFGKDFVTSSGKQALLNGQNEMNTAVLRYIASYLSNNDRDFVLHQKLKVKYLKYNWQLNQQR